MSDAAAPGSTARRWHVWAALFAPPFVLMVAFVPLVAYLVGVRGVAEAELPKVIESFAAPPVTLGFAAAFLLVRWLAARDGLTLTALGWTRPSPRELAIGAGAGALLAAANALVLYPLVQRFQPGFDPVVPGMSLLAAGVALSTAILAEETLYRGYGLVLLRTRHGVVACVAITSILYALSTPGPEVALKVWALGFGLVLALLRLWRGTLWPVAVAHLVVSLGPKVVATVQNL